jgi:hypothetical protein
MHVDISDTSPIDLAFLYQMHHPPRARNWNHGETREVCKDASTTSHAAQRDLSDDEGMRLDPSS